MIIVEWFIRITMSICMLIGIGRLIYEKGVRAGKKSRR